MALRQTTGFVESLVRLIGLDRTVPNFSTLSHRHRTQKVNIPYRGTNGPLHLLADSTGIKAEGEGEWNARKHGGAKTRVRHGRSDQWRDMAHGARSTSGSMKRRWISGRPSASQATSAMRTCCLNCSTRPPARDTASVTADGAFDTRKCHEAIAARGAAAIMPPRKNAKPWKPGTAGAIASNDILRTSTRFGRTIRERWSEYHRGLQEACRGSRLPWQHRQNHPQNQAADRLHGQRRSSSPTRADPPFQKAPRCAGCLCMKPGMRLRSIPHGIG